MSRNNYKKSKGSKKPNGKGYPKGTPKSRDIIPQELRKDDRDNDPNWYFTSPELAEQTSQLSFQSLLGYGTLNGYKVPTIARIDTVMNPGLTIDVVSIHNQVPIFDREDPVLGNPIEVTGSKAGVNLMAAKLYTLLSSFTGRTASYAPQDVAMMILAISSICEISETIRRIFGIGLTYNFRNRMLPLHLIDTMQCDSSDFAANLSIYRTRFNVAMARINQIPLLENIAFIKKSRDVYQNIYMDDPTNMSQLFYYFPRYAFFLDEKGDSDGSILRAVPFVPHNGAQNTMADMLTKLEQQITFVLESSTLNFIYADLLNMANKLSVPTWKFDYLAENYVVMPVYNNNALLQFHNLTITGLPGELDAVWRPNNQVSTGWDDKKHAVVNTSAFADVKYITGGASIFCDSDKNNIIYNPGFSDANLYLSKGYVDMPTDTPSTEDRIEALRYMSLFSGAVMNSSDVGAGNDLAILPALPDHYVVTVNLFNNWDSTKDAGGNSLKNFHSIVTASGITSSDWNGIAALTQFEHAFPIISKYGVGYYGLIFGQLQYYTEVDYAYLKRIDDIMSVGLFDFRS